MTDITFQQVDQDLGTLHQRSVALEGFQRWVVGHGTVTGDIARVIRISLEEADKTEGITGKDIVTGIKKVAVTLRNIVQWLLRQIGKLTEKIGVGLQRLGERGRNNEKRIKALPEEAIAKLESGEVELPTEKFNPSFLSIGGQFVGHEMEHVKLFITALKWFTMDLMQHFVHVVEQMKNDVPRQAKADSPDIFFKEAGGAISRVVKPPKISMGGSAAPNESSDTSIHTVPFFGDMGLVMFDPTKAVEAFSGGIESIREYLKLGFVEYNSKKNVELDRIPVPNINVLKQINQEMLGAVEYWEKHAAENKAWMRNVLDKVEASTEELTKGDNAAPAIGNALATTIQRFGSAIDEGSKYLVRTLNQEMHYVSTTLDAVSGKE